MFWLLFSFVINLKLHIRIQTRFGIKHFSAIPKHDNKNTIKKNNQYFGGCNNQNAFKVWCYISLILKTLYRIKPRDLKLLQKSKSPHIISIELSHRTLLLLLCIHTVANWTLTRKVVTSDRTKTKNPITFYTLIYFYYLINQLRYHVALPLQECTCCNNKLDIFLWAMFPDFLSAVFVQRITLCMLPLFEML